MLCNILRMNRVNKQDRSALVATLGFPVLVLAAGLIGFSFPATTVKGATWVATLLGIVMFTMGLTLKPRDFALVFTRPVPVIFGVIAQFVIMPISAVIVVKLLGLPSEIAAGVILVGCAPGGTSSNVVSYLARGDVALSVTVTSISTLLAPVLTPFLAAKLAGKYLSIEPAPMALSIVKGVLIPVVAGLLIGWLLPKLVAAIQPVLPWISVLAISAIVAVVVGGSAHKIAQAGAIVLVAVILHNLMGYVFGGAVGAALHRGPGVTRTLAIEVGMQNSGLAASLATTHMSPLAALPAAVFSVWHNMSGAILAAVCQGIDARRGDRAVVDK